VLQGTVCSELPGQVAPPGSGAGLVQVRFWVSVPPPHVLVHAVLLAQEDQLPLTAGPESVVRTSSSNFTTKAYSLAWGMLKAHSSNVVSCKAYHCQKKIHSSLIQGWPQ
jgi:hypothetical protein